MSRPLSLFSVQAILVLAIDDGSRILTKYYSNPHPPAGNQGDYPGQIAYKTVKDQKAFEKGLLGALPTPALLAAPLTPIQRRRPSRRPTSSSTMARLSSSRWSRT